MADISWQELSDGIGQETGDTLKDLGNLAADFFCNTYAQFPRAIIDSPFDNPGARFVDGLARRICAPRNSVPPPPPSPFEGGQCQVAYNVEFQYPFGGSTATSSVVLNGPIGGITSGGTGPNEAAVFIVCAPTPGVAPEGKFAVISQTPQQIQASINQVQIISVSRVDGQPDNCGNAPPQYDNKVPSIPDVSKPVPFPGLPVDVNIEINPVKIDPLVQIKPEFKINIGGIQLNLNIDGINFNLGPTFNFPPTLPPRLDPRPTPPPEYPGGDNPSNGDLSDQLTEGFEGLEDLLEELKECACDEPGLLVSTLLGSGSGGVFSLPNNTFKVFLELTQISQNAKVEFGNGNAPNVYYAGWFSFGSDGHWGTREPIDFESKFYLCPENANALQFTCRVGYEAQVFAFYRDPIE